MRKRENRMVVSFYTTTEAIAMEEACRKDQIAGRLIPLPTVISAGCGLAWSAPEESGAELLEYMKRKNLGFESAGIFMI